MVDVQLVDFNFWLDDDVVSLPQTTFLLLSEEGVAGQTTFPLAPLGERRRKVVCTA